MIYLLIADDNDIVHWHFPTDVILRRYDSGKKTVFDLQCNAFLDNNFRFQKSSIYAFCAGAVQNLSNRKKCREKLKEIQIFDHKVFRHFADTGNLEDKNCRVMASDMGKDYWYEKDIMPYSQMQIGESKRFPWLGIIDHIQKDHFKQQNCVEACNPLEQMAKAWNLASGFYQAEKPMRAMLEILWPLYFALMCDAESYDKEGTINAIRVLINSEPYAWVRQGIEVNAGDGKRLATNLEFPEAENSHQIASFLDWFQDLSRSYTEIMKLPPVENPFSCGAVDKP